MGESIGPDGIVSLEEMVLAQMFESEALLTLPDRSARVVPPSPPSNAPLSTFR